MNKLSTNKRGMIVSVSKSTSNEPWTHVHFTSREMPHFSSLAEIICAYHWSQIVWRDGRRLRDNFVSSDLLVLDFDDGKLPLEVLYKRLVTEKRAFILGTTKSHTADHNRFRLILKVDKSINDLRTYEYNARKYAKLFGSDPLACDGARKWAPCREIYSQQDGGAVTIVNPGPRKKYRSAAYIRTDKVIPLWVHQELKNGVPEGRRNHSCFKIAARLSTCGFCEDEIMDLISKSSIDLSERELRSVVRSGVRRAKRDVKGVDSR